MIKFLQTIDLYVQVNNNREELRHFVAGEMVEAEITRDRTFVVDLLLGDGSRLFGVEKGLFEVITPKLAYKCRMDKLPLP